MSHAVASESDTTSINKIDKPSSLDYMRSLLGPKCPLDNVIPLHEYTYYVKGIMSQTEGHEFQLSNDTRV